MPHFARRLAAWHLVLLFAVGGCSTASKPTSPEAFERISPADDLAQFGDEMAYFYLAPSQQRFEAFQNRAENLRAQLKGAGNGADLLVAVMIARISAAHGWPIADRGFGNVAKEVLEGQSPFARYVADDSAVDPTKLDVWWVSFFATGDDRFLDNIFRYAGLELPEHDVGLTLVIGAATWSFKANSRQHQRVLDFGKRKLGSPSVSEPQTTFLKECIAYAQAESEAEHQAPPDLRKVARP